MIKRLASVVMVLLLGLSAAALAEENGGYAGRIFSSL